MPRGMRFKFLGIALSIWKRAPETLRKLPHIDPKRVSMEMESLHAFVAQNDTLLKEKFAALANFVSTLKNNCESVEAAGQRAADMVDSVTQSAESVYSRMDRMQIVRPMKMGVQGYNCEWTMCNPSAEGSAWIFLPVGRAPGSRTSKGI